MIIYNKKQTSNGKYFAIIESEGSEKTREEWMRANQNSSMEFDLCLKINLIWLSSNSIKTT
jgi:hypothetical protein